MNILITGGSGFIGRNVTEDLSEGHRLFTPRHFELPIDDQSAMNEYFIQNRLDAIIHCATKPAHRNAQDTTNVLYANMRLFSSLFEAARTANITRFIIIGSGSEYDMRHYRPRMPEEYLGTHIPADENGLSKYLETRLIANDRRFVNLRFFGIFGKYEDYAIRFISNMICKALFSMPLTIKQDRRFDYIGVSDGIKVIRYFLEHPSQFSDYNVTTDETIWLSEIAAWVRDLSGKDLPIVISNPEPGTEYSGDNARAARGKSALFISHRSGRRSRSFIPGIRQICRQST